MVVETTAALILAGWRAVSRHSRFGSRVARTGLPLKSWEEGRGASLIVVSPAVASRSLEAMAAP
jgi:hypothetical protein